MAGNAHDQLATSLQGVDELLESQGLAVSCQSQQSDPAIVAVVSEEEEEKEETAVVDVDNSSHAGAKRISSEHATKAAATTAASSTNVWAAAPEADEPLDQLPASVLRTLSPTSLDATSDGTRSSSVRSYAERLAEPDISATVLTGMLEKLSGDRPIIAMFQKRFFKLETLVFCWAAKEGDPIKNSIFVKDIKSVMFVPVDQYGHAHMFRVDTLSKHYYLKAESDSVCRKWMAAITAVAALPASAVSMPPDESASLTGTSPPPDNVDVSSAATESVKKGNSILRIPAWAMLSRN